MKKLTKQLLTGVIALGLLAPVATTAVNPINTTVNAKRHHHRRARRHYVRWHKGVPKALVPRNRKYALKSHGHMRVFMSRKGMSLLYDGGAPTSYNAGTHAHYRYLGHGTYHIKGIDENFIIKKRGHHYSVRDNGHYIGYCYRTLYRY